MWTKRHLRTMAAVASAWTWRLVRMMAGERFSRPSFKGARTMSSGKVAGSTFLGAVKSQSIHS